MNSLNRIITFYTHTHACVRTDFIPKRLKKWASAFKEMGFLNLSLNWNPKKQSGSEQSSVWFEEKTLRWIWRTADWSINEKINKTAFDLAPFYMAWVEWGGIFTWIQMRGKHFTCSSLYHCTPEGLKASASLFLFKWQQHTRVDTHICSAHTHTQDMTETHTCSHWHTHTHTPSCRFHSLLSGGDAHGQKPMVAFLVFFPSSSPFSLSLSFSRLSPGKHTILFHLANGAEK